MSFYLKFRPQRIGELDLHSVRENLGKILQSGKVPHAFLFLGPRGAGKTSAARIVAKMVNCEKNRENITNGKPLEEPCLKCDRCLSIGLGQDVDVIEIDAASNRSIDDIRSLKENVGLMPAASLRKVYVIDEVHMLTNDAFNALLKTIEEPPAHVIFVLCTTEAHKVPATIVSRCTMINFGKATIEEVVESLKKVVSGEKLDVADEALHELAGFVDGSFREAHKLLEQLSLLSHKIGLDEVKKLVGVGTLVEPVEFVKTLAQLNAGSSLELVSKIDNGGINWVNYLKSSLDVVRLELRGVYGLGERRTQIDKEILVKLAEAMLLAVGKVKNSPVEVLPVELMVVGISDNSAPKATKPTIKEVAQKVQESEVRVEKGSQKIEKPEKKVVMEAPVATTAKTDRVLNTSLNIDEVVNNWQKVIEILEPMNHSVAALLKSQRIMEVSNGEVVVEVGYKFHKEQLENETKRIMIEEAFEQVVGNLKLRCVLKEKEVATEKETAELSSAVEDVFGIM